ncbi:MAG: hypothetical protein MOB07_08045 [Acidobacteria bacterium]|nr:hypothetical protein [Acidobacteriota bacterium]
MSHIITLHLPDSFFQPIKRLAQATHQPVEQLLLNALQASLPPLAGLPDDVTENLTMLELLDDQALRMVMLESMSPEQAERIHNLLDERQIRSLSAEKEEELARLQFQADLVMLRKARAIVLLRFRGQQIPTPAELGQLAGQIK